MILNQKAQTSKGASDVGSNGVQKIYYRAVVCCIEQKENSTLAKNTTRSGTMQIKTPGRNRG